MTPEAEHAFLSLEHKMHGPPRFSQDLKDQAVSSGATGRLSCHLTGTTARISRSPSIHAESLSIRHAWFK